MPDRSMLRQTKVVIGFAIRHATATVATVIAACALWTLVYFGLIVWAIITDGGLGGPLAYPGFLILLAVAALTFSAVLFLPASGLAEWVCRRSGLPILVQIPVSVAFLALLSPLAALLIQGVRKPANLPESTLVLGIWLFGLSLVPLGFYWWVAQSVPLVRELLRKVFVRNVATAPDKLGGT